MKQVDVTCAGLCARPVNAGNNWVDLFRFVQSRSVRVLAVNAALTSVKFS